MAMLAPQPVVQRRQVDTAALLLIAPMEDGFGMRRRLQLLPAPSIGSIRRPALPVISYRSLAHPEKPRNRALRMTVHAVYLPRPRIEISGPQGVQATFDWQAARDSTVGRMCTATRVIDVEAY